MRIILGSRKRYHVRGVSVFLIMTALIVGMAGCDDGGSGPCTLTITSRAGGSVTTPGEGSFTYDEGTVVSLVATADDGYGFQGWTGDTDGVANTGSGATTMILSQDSSITANFGPAGPPGPSTP